MSDQPPSSFTLTFDRNDGEKIPLGAFALLFVGTQWSWGLNNRCKHLVLFMDTRERMVRVFDRDYRALALAELTHQTELPRLPGEEPPFWEREIPPVEEVQRLELENRTLREEVARLQEAVAACNTGLNGMAGKLAALGALLGFAPDETTHAIAEKARKLNAEVAKLKIELGVAHRAWQEMQSSLERSRDELAQRERGAPFDEDLKGKGGAS